MNGKRYVLDGGGLRALADAGTLRAKAWRRGVFAVGAEPVEGEAGAVRYPSGKAYRRAPDGSLRRARDLEERDG